MSTTAGEIDAVRTVGQLLLHRPTIGFLARDIDGYSVDPLSSKACKFCYMGATSAVANKLGVNDRRLDDLCYDTLKLILDGSVWDSASDRQKKAWARKLANYNG